MAQVLKFISEDFEVKRRLVGSVFLMFMSEKEWNTMKFNHYVQSHCIKLSGHSFQSSFESGVNNHKKAVTSGILQER